MEAAQKSGVAHQHFPTNTAQRHRTYFGPFEVRSLQRKRQNLITPLTASGQSWTWATRNPENVFFCPEYTSKFVQQDDVLRGQNVHRLRALLFDLRRREESCHRPDNVFPEVKA